MNTNTVDIVREIVHTGSAVLLVIMAAVAVIGFAKPHVLRRIFKEFAQRRYILGSAVFACLLCGTVFTATQPTAEPLQSNVPQPITDSAEAMSEPDDQNIPESSTQQTEVQTDDPVNTDSIPGYTTSSSPQGSSAAPAPPSQVQPAPGGNVSSLPGHQPPPPPSSAAPKDCKIVQLLFVCI